MSAPRARQFAPRLDRPDVSRLALALAVSLTLHLGGYGAYEGGKALHLWDRLRLPTWVEKLARSLTPTRAIEAAKQPDKPREAPLMFVEVEKSLPKPETRPKKDPLTYADISPIQPASEPPKDAEYYAALNSRAANPDPVLDTTVPKISGNQEQVMRTEDSVRSSAQPLRPSPPTSQPPEPEIKPKATLRPGDLTMAKPEDQNREGERQQTNSRPRTLVEARAQLAPQQPLRPDGSAVRQDGGVRQRSNEASIDAIGTEFGRYDRVLGGAIQNRWDDLLEERGYAFDKVGIVVIEFRLNYDGRVMDWKIVEHTVDDLLSLLCVKAILDPSPYSRWPSDMRRKAGADFRDVRIIFYY